MSLAGAALVSAESILALTPIAIKKTPLDPISAIWSRLLSSAVLGYALADDKSLPASERGAAAALGYTNLLHVACSYESFRNLPAGEAMSLLYTYPMWNLVLSDMFTQEKISSNDYGIIGVATLGSLMLNLDPGHTAPSAIGRTANRPWGVFTGLVMAFTEAIMHTILKVLGWTDPAKSVWVVSASASAWLGVAVFIQELIYDGAHDSVLRSGSRWDAMLLTAFHSITLFSGYWLRFYAVPRLSTVTYSVLSYAGLIASYLFGLAFVGERPGWMSLLGTLVIIGSGIALQLPK